MPRFRGNGAHFPVYPSVLKKNFNKKTFESVLSHRIRNIRKPGFVFGDYMTSDGASINMLFTTDKGAKPAQLVDSLEGEEEKADSNIDSSQEEDEGEAESALLSPIAVSLTRVYHAF